MKRNLILFLAASLLILSSCATLPRKPIAQGDLIDLKGKWEGVRNISFSRTPVQTHAEMEIFNDTLPLKGEITFSLESPGDRRAYPFDNGQIDPQGNLVIKPTDTVRVELTLHKGQETMRLLGSISQPGGQGTITLHKKR